MLVGDEVLQSTRNEVDKERQGGRASSSDDQSRHGGSAGARDGETAWDHGESVVSGTGWGGDLVTKRSEVTQGNRA